VLTLAHSAELGGSSGAGWIRWSWVDHTGRMQSCHWSPGVRLYSDYMLGAQGSDQWRHWDLGIGGKGRHLIDWCCNKYKIVHVV